MNKVSNVRWSTTSSKCKSFGNYKLDLGYVRIITNRILLERNLPMESWDRKNRQTKKLLNWNNKVVLLSADADVIRWCYMGLLKFSQLIVLTTVEKK